MTRLCSWGGVSIFDIDYCCFISSLLDGVNNSVFQYLINKVVLVVITEITLLHVTIKKIILITAFKLHSSSSDRLLYGTYFVNNGSSIIFISDLMMNCEV